MPDEDGIKQAEDEGQNSALDQPDQEPVEQDDDSADSTDSLPDDPELLKQELKARDEQLRAAKKDAREAKKDAERHKERADEERKGKEQWYEVAKGKGSAPAKPADEPEPKRGAPTLKSALKGMDLAEYVADGDEGTARLLDDLVARGVIITPAQVEKMLDQREDQIHQVNVAYQRATEDFPELLDKKSPLAKETLKQLKTLKTEKPHLGEDDLLDIAIARAARKVGVSAQNGNGHRNGNGNSNHSDDVDEDTERDRRRKAQGNNGARSNQPAAIVITAQDRAMFAKQGITKDADIRSVKAEAAKLHRNAIQ